MCSLRISHWSKQAIHVSRNATNLLDFSSPIKWDSTSYATKVFHRHHLQLAESKMSNHTVIVWSEPHTIEVYRKYKTVWVASGEYKGATITVQDQTEGQPL